MSLPKFMVLKSVHNNKYLRYIDACHKGTGFLEFAGDDISYAGSKLEVVVAKSDPNLFHLKCCYNNKFLTRLEPHKWWLVARSDQPVEDRDHYGCTLFEPEFVDPDRKTVRFRHVQLNFYARPWIGQGEYGTKLLASSMEADSEHFTDLFTYIDWELHNASMGPAGGSEGKDFSFDVVGGGITKITIRSGRAVDAIGFEGQCADGSLRKSRQFGGYGGNEIQIPLDWPNEYLTMISGTSGVFSDVFNVITSLEFTTNRGKSYGPYGYSKDGTPFSYGGEGKIIIGFHGRSSCLLDAIGIYTGTAPPPPSF